MIILEKLIFKIECCYKPFELLSLTSMSIQTNISDEDIQRLGETMARFAISIKAIVEQCNHLNATVNARQLVFARFQIEGKEAYTPETELNKILESKQRVDKLNHAKDLLELKAVVIECDLYHLFQYLYTTGQIVLDMDDLQNGAGVSRVLESQSPADQESAEKAQGASEKVTIKNLGAGRRIEQFHYAARITSRQVITVRAGKRQMAWKYNPKT